MLDSEIKFLKEVLASVLPNIVYPDELREAVDERARSSESLRAFIDNFAKLIAAEPDITRKTDKRIYLNELRRKASPTSLGREVALK